MSFEVVGVIPAVADEGLSHWASLSFMEKLAALVPSIVYVYNQRTQSNEYSNRSIGELIGFSVEEIQAMGAEFMPRLAHPDDLPRIGEYFGHLVKMKDGEVCMIEYRMRRKSGGWAWLRSYDTIFERDENGEVVRQVGVATDISVQKEAAARLALLNGELAEFAYVATHDMKTPINNISGLCAVLQAMPEFQTGQAAEVLGRIRRSCDQADQKIRDIVEVAVATRSGEQAQTLDLGEVMQTVRSRLEAELEGAEVVETYGVSTVHFPRVQLESVLENLLGNAAKCRSPQRALRIEVFSALRSDGAPVVGVRDNGIGIDVERDGERIMGLFKRAETSLPGSGVGLYLVRQMMLRGGGSVEVEGVLGQFAEFRLIFPPEEGNHDGP